MQTFGVTGEGHQALTPVAESPRRPGLQQGEADRQRPASTVALRSTAPEISMVESSAAGSFDEEAMMGSSSRTEARHSRSLWRHLHIGVSVAPTTLYQLTDRLHEGRTVRVPVNAIGPTVSAWLAELGANSPMVEDLARAVRNGDWPAAYAVGEHLSVHVAIAA